MSRRKARVVLVSGSRYWGEERCPTIERELARLPRGSWVIHGAQRRRTPESFEEDGDRRFTGVDYWADRIAQELGLIRVQVPFVPGMGKAGGPVRNAAMCEIAKALEAAGHEVSALFFHDDIERSRGTKDCRSQAERAGLSFNVIQG